VHVGQLARREPEGWVRMGRRRGPRFARLAAQDGQGMVEYGLIIALVAVAATVVLGALGAQLHTVFCSVWIALAGPGSCP
jgi:Flp pilus assembly pilin Flp